MSNSSKAEVVRPFRASDRGALEDLWSSVFADDPTWNAPALMIADKLRIQPELLLVYTSADELVGAIMAGYDGVRGWLYHLAVSPQARRRGIGSQLVREAEARLFELGCTKVNLQVRTANPDVIAFYATLGYRVEERVSMGRRLVADQA